MMVLVTGGSGSGKSLLAESMAVRLKREPLYYLATMKLWDAECEMRVQKHRQQRAGKGFCTVETPDHLREAAANLEMGGSALLDCISNLVANEQFGTCVSQPAQVVVTGVLALANRLEHLVIVTNEVCSDGIPQDKAMQTYLQTIGAVNCALAKEADIVVEVCAGIPVLWKGEKEYHEIMG